MQEVGNFALAALSAREEGFWFSKVANSTKLDVPAALTDLWFQNWKV